MPTSRNEWRVRAATLCLVNRERTGRGRGKLKRNRTLEHVARRYTKSMVRKRFFGHVAPNGDTLTDRVKRTGYVGSSVRRWALGENIAWGAGRRGTARRVVASWMKSSGHRRNILDPRFREAGFGVAAGAPGSRGGSGAATYTNVFGRRVRR